MRLIHCLVDIDDIKRAYLRRNDIPKGRLHLDNRNSVDKRARTVCEMIADQFNDETFSPQSEAVEGLHSEFITSEVLLDYSLVQGMLTATAERCQLKLSKMMARLKRFVEKWEMSGQGKGALVEVHIHHDEQPRVSW